MIANIDRSSDRLFRNDLPPGASDFLRIDLVGTVSNGFGVGARIEVEERGLTQIREIVTGTGFCSQAPFTAHFGLGAPAPGDSTVDRVTVRWPSGVVQTVTGIAPNARIVLVEDDPTPVRSPDVPAAAPGLRLAPNPFRRETELRFDLAAPGAASVIVFDVAGRAVRNVLHDDLGPGRHRVVWDGRDERHRPVPAGIYFLRLEAPGGRRTARVVRITP